MGRPPSVSPATFFGEDFAKVEREVLAKSKTLRTKKWPLYKRKLTKLVEAAAAKVRPDGFRRGAWREEFVKKHQLKQGKVTNRRLASVHLRG